MTHYETLGVTPTADDAEIKRGYRRAARRAHPDQGGSVESMQAVNRAYDVLRDPERRTFYDATGLDSPEAIPPEQLQDQLINAQAEDCLRQVLKQVLDAESDRMLFKQAQAMLDGGTQKTTKAISSAEYRLKKLQARRDRVTVADGQRNALHLLIDGEVAGLQETIHQATHDRKVIQAAAVLLKAYDTTEPLFQEPNRSTYSTGGPVSSSDLIAAMSMAFRTGARR